MELHLAIKNILKYQGEEFLLDPKMVNALTDFQAYEQYPALKNVFRVLHQDGYVGKVKDAGKWDTSLDQMVYEIERDYAFPRDLVEYSLKSVLLGLGHNCSLPTCSFANASHNRNANIKQKPQKSWKNMTPKERNSYLTSLIEVNEESFKAHKVRIDSCSAYINHHEELVTPVAISGKMKKDDFIELICAVFDKNGVILCSDEIGGCSSDDLKCGIYTNNNHFVATECDFSEIGKLVIYCK